MNVGLGVAAGTTNRGGAAGDAVEDFGSGTFAAGGAGDTAGLLSTGGAIVGGAAVAAGPCCLLMMAFKASPGLEI